MPIPVQIVFHDVEPSPAVAARIEARALDLDRFAAGVSRCRVVIEAPPGHAHKGRTWRVVVECALRGDELVVGRAPRNDPARDDLYGTIDDAFDVMLRRLQDHFDRLRDAREGRM